MSHLDRMLDSMGKSRRQVSTVCQACLALN